MGQSVSAQQLWNQHDPVQQYIDEGSLCTGEESRNWKMRVDEDEAGRWTAAGTWWRRSQMS